MQNIARDFQEKNTSLLTFGGSVVILMPACKMVMGNSGCGDELSQSLKLM